MSRRVKVLVSVMVSILVFGIGGATMALAQDGEDVAEEETPGAVLPGSGSGELLARVAEKLGITGEELKEAIREAREEIIEERITERLERLLEHALAEGLIDEDEAQEIRDWWQDRGRKP